MSTEELIVISNVGLIVVSVVGIGASVLANDRLAEVTRSLIYRILPISQDTSKHGKHERQ